MKFFKIKLFKYLIPLLCLVVCTFISFSFMFSSCKERTSEEIGQAETLIEEPSTAQIQKSPALYQMIGEMIILGFKGTEINSSSKIVEDINEYYIGGVILFDFDVPSKSFPRNIENPWQTKKLIKDLKKLTRSDLFIAVDAEGGYVNRLKAEYGFIKIESPQVMGESDPQNTFLKASLLGIELDDLGFNLNFAPVVDVNINKDNPIIGGLERSFSDDPVRVYEHAGFFMDAMHKYNIITTIKHFPGHGSSTEDSHIGLTDITDTYNEKIELFPYKKLIEDNKTDMIMTAHVINTNIDPDNPATLSSIFLKDILKSRLNYVGVIVSDDMQMEAITNYFGFEESIIKAINAGCNLLIYSNNNQEYEDDIAQRVVETIKKAVKEGKITEEEIINSYNKIRKLKEDYGIY
ncbi:MAG: glycoside hydrolase family 3 protein [Actinobacteria bacterium]|nr:glycoside hydrolase family 3 protein [Actinomycetota bacterium]